MNEYFGQVLRTDLRYTTSIPTVHCKRAAARRRHFHVAVRCTYYSHTRRVYNLALVLAKSLPRLTKLEPRIRTELATY